ncbi:MAG: amino acid permease [Spirochaetes bacterium]|nr:amino acid permease [Spirochaetota bacterium]
MQLKKELSTIDVFSIASGAMISSGLFVLPAVAYKIAGIGIVFSYFFAGFFMLPALFTQLELVTAMPRAGGTYFFSERILGTAVGVIDGFGNWFSISLKSAFALIGIGAFAELLFPGISEFQMKLIAGSACLFFTTINLINVKSSGKIQVILVAFLLFILTLFILFGYRSMDFHFVPRLTAKTDWSKVLTTTGMVFISYGGLTKVASIAEEVKNPKKNIPKGAITAFIVVQTYYILVVFIIVGLLPHNKLIYTHTPVTDAAVSMFSQNNYVYIALVLTVIAAMLAFITTANAGIMTASRVPLSMSRDGLLPQFINIVSKKRKIPVVSILLTSMFMLIVIFLLDIEKLAKVASLFMLLLFTMINFSLIVIRYSKVSNYKPAFKSPFFPFLQIFGILIYLFLIVKMGLFTTVIAFSFIVLALFWFFIYVKKKVKRKSALVHMIENITGPDLTDKDKELEGELLDILIERDEIVLDRFDKIIKDCTVIDLDRTVTRDELFKIIAQRVSKTWNIDEKEIEKKLNEREALASTLIYPGVALPHAIPHIIIAGEHKFDIMLIRNKYGIKWNENGEVVYTAFCIIGTKDERNFHLRALMYIAQILQDPDFHKEWVNAKNENELRSVILLAKRRRK